MRLLQQAKPAFSFEQSDEPQNPQGGQVWRQRGTGGDFIADWEWISSLMEWVALTPYDINSTPNTGSGAIATTVADFTERRRLVVSSTVQATYVSGNPFDANNRLTITPVLLLANGGIVGNLNAGAMVLDQSAKTLTAPINKVYTAAKIRLSRGSVIGAPGVSTTTITLRVRDVK